MRHEKALRTLALAAAATLASAPARAQFRAGPEFRVNTYTLGDQYRPRISVEREGEFVVVWQSYAQDGDDYGVFGQAFREDGSRRGNEFRGTVATLDRQERPVVAHDGNEFVVAWASYGQDGDGFSVHARRFAKDGTPIGAAFQVNTYTTGDQKVTAIAKDRTAGSRGAFVVVWTDYGQDYGNVMARRYDADGVPRGGEFRVNVFTDNLQTGGRVGMADDGRFVIAWSSYGQDGPSHGVFARRFDAAGSPLGGDLQVNTTTSGDEYTNGLAVAADGRFVVVWQQLDGSSMGVFGRSFNAAGQPQAVEFRANTYTTLEQQLASVAISERGDFVVAWQSFTQDGDGYGIFGQRFDKSTNRVGQEFQVATYTTGYQIVPAAGMDSVGNFVVSWASLAQDGSASGVYAQRFGGILFPDMALDTSPTLGRDGALASDGNGVLEPGETVVFDTVWRNVSGSPQGPIAGRVLSFTGPPGPTYVVPDPDARFGVIPVAGTVSCRTSTGDCYVIGVSGSRPATHWDGIVEEGVNSIILGQAKLWPAHVGESFTDVPRTNPFYKFIETLLHNGVTTGCAAGRYCPLDSTSREQMAVFVLVSAEGATFRPIPCGTVPMFNDVPVTSGFCPWVEELARRGVVSGCAPGSYCPSAPVSREQMAVFVLRTLDAEIDPPACTTPMFTDVPASSPFCRWIEELVRRGVVSGCAPQRYCPQDPVTREQMGVFLTVTFGLKLYGG